MNRTSEQVREALVHLVVKILSVNQDHLTSIWLSRLGSTDEGEQLIDAMSSSSLVGIKYLNLGDNKTWWTNKTSTI